MEKSVESILYTGKQLLKVQPEAGGADDDVEKNKYHGGTSGKVDLDKIIRYSQLISHTTSEGNPGLDGLYQLPMPAEQQIQSGILYEVSGAEVAEVAEDNSRHETHSPALGESDLFAPVYVFFLPWVNYRMSLRFPHFCIFLGLPLPPPRIYLQSFPSLLWRKMLMMVSMIFCGNKGCGLLISTLHLHNPVDYFSNRQPNQSSKMNPSCKHTGAAKNPTIRVAIKV